jgi:hypothetical protein
MEIRVARNYATEYPSQLIVFPSQIPLPSQYPVIFRRISRFCDGILLVAGFRRYWGCFL